MRTIDAVGIVAGTAIGGGVLALPLVTTPIGYLPALCGLVGVWSFLVLTGVAFVEAAGHVIAEDKDATTISHAKVMRVAFGPRASILSSLAFMAQMAAVMTAQVVKGGEFIVQLTGMNYYAACLLPTIVFGIFSFCARLKVVERANTALTAAIMLGFGALVFAALGSGAFTSGALFAVAKWDRLLPMGKQPWAVPILLNMLCFCQSVPLVVERMAMAPMATDADGDDGSSPTADNQEHSSEEQVAHGDELAPRLLKTRHAVVLGASVPLLLTTVWAAVSTALVPPAAVASGADPLFTLLGLGPAVGIPVGTLAVGAIGTTLLSSFLAVSHFFADALCTRFGYCDLGSLAWCRVATVALPCLLACGGPTLYLPLLAFAGAYPTTILYGLAPALAALRLRRRAEEAADGHGHRVLRLLPGGSVALGSLVLIAASIVGSAAIKSAFW